MKRTMKQLCDGKVWRAVEAMITGLEEQSKREDFKIDMHTYGSFTNIMCFGCAATCTVQKLTKHNYSVLRIGSRISRASSIDVPSSDLAIFENAINHLREGSIRTLFLYFGKDIPRIFSTFCLPYLDNNSWHENLGPYRLFLKYLKFKDI